MIRIGVFLATIMVACWINQSFALEKQQVMPEKTSIRDIKDNDNILSAQTKIAFSTDDGIYVANIDGSHKTKVTIYFEPEVDPGLRYIPPVKWSPDGKRLIFRYYKSVHRVDNMPLYGLVSFVASERNISIVNMDGTARQTLFIGDSPAWSPDGKKIVFQYYDDSEKKYYLSLVNIDGTNRMKIGPPISIVPRGGSPEWSPDGNKIVYVDGGNIYIIRSDGSNRMRLVYHAYEPSWFDEPSWSPDGEYITFCKYEGGNTDIYLISANGENQRRLTANKGNNDSPSWSPDRSKIVFSSDRDGYRALYIMNSNGSQQTKLNGTEGAYNPSWSPFLK